MKLMVKNLKMSLNDDIKNLNNLVAKKLNIKIGDIKNLRILKESIDARRKNNIQLIYSITLELDSSFMINNEDVKKLNEINEEKLIPGNILLNERPVIVGCGPAGLFAALILAENGYNPLILERGDSIEKRTKAVADYWQSGELNPESNVQFGEGGAGTFSDGKLTTRINDPKCEKVLDEFHKSGISHEILYKARPHIGTDNLKKVLINMRKKIINNGGEFKFRSKVTSLKIKNNKITGIIINGNEEIFSEVIILAIGHSARDTFEQLYTSGVNMIQKPFSMGLRIEHPQKLIDFAQYGNNAGHFKLGVADYQLFYKSGTRCAYTFCMCPGGIVVASASEKGMIVTNGMSEFRRDKENANSAWVVSVNSEDFENSHPLAGIKLQQSLEQLAFKFGGNDNSAPVQTLGDFLSEENSKKLGTVKPSYTGKIKITDLNLFLPDFIKNPMKQSVSYFNNKLKGFAMPDAVLTGVETRTSSPVTILRDETFQSIGIKGLYPIGEGAGYAGGIVSAAVDGIRVAEQIITAYKM